MFHRTGASNSTVAAVVIGKYQSFAAYNFAGAAAAKNQYSIF